MRQLLESDAFLQQRQLLIKDLSQPLKPGSKVTIKGLIILVCACGGAFILTILLSITACLCARRVERIRLRKANAKQTGNNYPQQFDGMNKKNVKNKEYNPDSIRTQELLDKEAKLRQQSSLESSQGPGQRMLSNNNNVQNPGVYQQKSNVHNLDDSQSDISDNSIARSIFPRPQQTVRSNNENSNSLGYNYNNNNHMGDAYSSDHQQPRSPYGMEQQARQNKVRSRDTEPNSTATNQMPLYEIDFDADEQNYGKRFGY